MRFRGIRLPLLDVVIGVGFGSAAVLFDLLLVPVPLYLTEGCEPNSCVNVAPRIHVVPLIAGVLATSLWAVRRTRTISPGIVGLGLLMGVLAVLATGVLEAAALPFTDPYFTTLYRVWGLVIVFVTLSLGVATATWWARTGSHPLALIGLAGLGVVLGVAMVLTALRGQMPIMAAAAAGVVAGLVVGRLFSRPGSPRPGLVLTGIVVVAFVSRLFFGIQTLRATGPGMAFAVASDDGDSYFTLASRLADDPTKLGEILSGIAFPPGYTSFLAGIFALTGDSLAAVIAAQAALAALATYLVYVLGRRMFGTGPGLLAAALFALDQNLIQNAATLTAEALLVPVILGALVAASAYLRSRALRHLLLLAILVGLAFVVRNVVALPLAVALILWLITVERDRPLRVAQGVVLIAAMTLLFSLPIAVATAQKDGTPRFTTQLAALAWTFDGGKGYTIPNRVLVARGIDPFADPLGSLARAVADPALILRFYGEAAPQRLSTLLFFANRGYSDPLIIVNEAYFPNAFGETVRLLRIVAVFAGVWAVLRLRAWRVAPELTAIALYTVLYISVFVFLFPPYHAFRYRIPVEPVRFLFEAGGVFALWAAASTAAYSSRVSPSRAGATLTLVP